MKIINTSNMPTPGGHYSMCIQHNGTLYLAGQLPFKPGTREKADSIEGQTKQVLENVRLIVTEAGSSLDQVIQMRLYIPDIEMWDAVNQIYSEFFGSHKPVRTVVPCRDLHYGCLIEVEAIAAI